MSSATIRVEIPHHLRTLAQVNGEISLQVPSPITLRRVLDVLEARYPVLCGTIRDHGTQQRRPFLRFFACSDDLSHISHDAPLPEAVAEGREPLLIVGAIAGGSGRPGRRAAQSQPRTTAATQRLSFVP
jgi:sulfur-carrier protein